MTQQRRKQRVQKIDEKRLKFNPLVRDLLIPVTEVESKTDYVLDKEDKATLVNKRFLIEQGSSAHFFQSPTNRKAIGNCDPQSKALLLYIMGTINPGKDWVKVNYNQFMDENNISSYTTYLAAVRQLDRYDFIRKTEYDNVFYINPRYFFNGDRKTVFSQNIDTTTKRKFNGGDK